MTKYGSRRCECDGHEFDSELERSVYLALKDIHDAGNIRNLHLQHSFPLTSNIGDPIGNYRADFMAEMADSSRVAIEAKGVPTALWNWKRKHFQADYPSIRLMVITKENLADLYELRGLAA